MRQQPQQQKGGARGAAAGRGAPPQQRTRERFLVEMQWSKAEEQRAGLHTVCFSIDSLVLGDLKRQGVLNGDDVFLLRPRAKKPPASLEEGEVSDEEVEGVGGGGIVHYDGDRGQVLDWEAEARQPHVLAVMLDADDKKAAVANRTGRAGFNDLLRFRIWLPALDPDQLASEAQEGEPHWHALQLLRGRGFRKGTEWVGVFVASVTTTVREFAALREVQRIRLAARLIHGGREKTQSDLKVVSKDELMGMWKAVAELSTKCESKDQTTPGNLNQLIMLLAKLKRVRVSVKLLADSGVGKLLNDFKKKGHWSPQVKEVCKTVLAGWKQQVGSERECYDASNKGPTVIKSPTPPKPPPRLDGENAQPTPDGAAGGGSASTPAPLPVKCPIQVPGKLWRVLCAEYNAPQLRAIAAACQTNTKSFLKQGEITLLQGPPGTGKTRTILGLLSAILHLSVDRLVLLSASQKTGSASNVRPAVRAPGGSQRNNRILVCAPSNGAVDVIVARLLGDGLFNSEGKRFHPPIVRLGMTDPSSPANVQACTLDSQVDSRLQSSLELKAFQRADEEVTRLRADLNGLSRSLAGGAEEADGGRRQLEMSMRQARVDLGRAQKARVEALRALDAARARIRVSVIREAKIVLSTLSTSAGAQLADAVAAIGVGYGTVVVDEAGQAVEPSTIIPLR